MCPSSSAARGRPFSEPAYPVLGSRSKGRPGFALGQKAGLLAGEGEDSGNGGPYGRGPAGSPTAGKARRRIPAGGRGPYERGPSCRKGSPYRSGSITISPSLSRRTRTHSTSCSTLRLALPMRRWTLGRIRRAWSTPSPTNSSAGAGPAPRRLLRPLAARLADAAVAVGEGPPGVEHPVLDALQRGDGPRLGAYRVELHPPRLDPKGPPDELGAGGQDPQPGVDLGVV